MGKPLGAQRAVYVKLFMGLGNQLFQYAAGRSLALSLGVPLKVDLSWYGDDGWGGAVPRRYELPRTFALDPPIASKEEHDAFSFSQPALRAWTKVLRSAPPFGLPYEQPVNVVRWTFQGLNAVRPTYRSATYWEPHFHADRHFFDASPPVLLYGYWQSWRYFYPHRAQVLGDLAFRPEVLEPVADRAAELRASRSVAVHVRLTDRLNPGYRPPTAEYYRRAFAIIQATRDSPTWHLFSDDPEAARDLLPSEARVEIESGRTSMTPEQDLALLSSCQDVITGNSSFSWWGAHLQDPGDRITVAPRHWHARGRHQDRDLHPPHWHLVDDES